MKIVVLDGYTLNPGDMSWDEMGLLGELVVYDRTPADKINERIDNAEIVLTNKVILTKEILEQTPSIKYIGVMATGYNVVEIQYARERGIIVTNVPAYSTDSVAQMVFAFILEFCHHVGEHNRAVQEGKWAKNIDFSFWDYPLIEIKNKTLGIIGFGAIGQKVAKIAEVFGMKVLFHSRTIKPGLETDNMKSATLEKVLAESDFITLHCPLTEQTKGLINKDTIAGMKNGAFLINTSRGPVIDENDVAQALNAGKLTGLGTDVVSIEPIQAENPLLNAKNCIITPHFAWATKEARERLMNTLIKNIDSFIKGTPVNVVNNH